MSADGPLNVWETIDHRWLLRRADNAHVPSGCPASFDFLTNALRWAQVHGYCVRQFPEAVS
jgi:hypothetical protein